jgi:hypothetical protein
MHRRIIGLIGVASMMALVGSEPLRAAEVAARLPDFTGEWRLDPKRSDAPARPGPDGSGAGSGRGGMWGGGGAGGRGGSGSGRGGWSGGRGGAGGWSGGGAGGIRVGTGGRERGAKGDAAAAPGARPVRLPELMHVTQTDGLVSFEDSTGAVLQEITTLGGKADTLVHAPGAQVIPGGWKDGALEFERKTPRGGTIHQSITLDDAGNTLVFHTILEGGDMPKREFKRVYQRTTDS